MRRKGNENMHNANNYYPRPYYNNTPMVNWDNMYYQNQAYLSPYHYDIGMYYSPVWNQLPHQCLPPTSQPPASEPIVLKDYGPNPFVVNIEEATRQNNYFRIVLWTGEHLQLTLMSINPCEEIGLEIHPELDQFIRIEEGQGMVKIGDCKENLGYQRKILDDDAILIPAGKWHNIINTGKTPLKLYSLYAPPEHPFGTVHKTKKDAEEHDHY
jgi:mannose-6-phosphate isomerase-like protein (cupin superfamily)